MDEIVKCKENIQPLRQGRNTEQLCEAISESKQNKHLAQMEQHELRLRSYEGDDPLEPWHTYITWMEQTSTGRGKLFRSVLKQCLKNFSANAAYYNDTRLVDLWLKYLSVQPNRMELYETVLGHGIGINSAIFYQRWAGDLELNGDIRGADKIFLRGLNENIDDRESLQQAHMHFQMRVAKAQMTGDKSCVEATPQRNVLGRLESRDGGVAAERAHSHILGSNKPMQKPIKDEAAFSVFAGGENEKPKRQAMKVLPDERARVENEAAPTKWTDAASGREARPIATTPFKVLEDPVSSTPSGIQLTASKRILQVVKSTKKDAEWPLAYFEPVDEKSKPMYCKDKVYCGGTEFSFEELRAATWSRKRAAREKAKMSQPQPTAASAKEVLVYETVVDGQEWSYEEIRAKKYMEKKKRKLEQMENPKYPLAYFEPENPNQVRMYDKKRVYADGTEFSPEELRAKDWVAKSQSAVSCQSALLSQSVLGQSMTVHTREAMAAVQDLWQSTRESPPVTPPPPPPQKFSFNIYQDDGRGASAAAAFEIFSDVKTETKIAENQENIPVGKQEKGSCFAAPFAIFSDNQENAPPVVQCPFTSRPVLQPKFEIFADNVKYEEEEGDDDEEEEEDEEPFEVKPLPPLPELPYVAPPEEWVSNGPEGKENLSPIADCAKQLQFADDEDTHFIMGPLGDGPVNYLEDVTVGLMIRPPPVNSSTPFGHQPQSLLMPPPEARHTMLSPILEMTGESRGSRSGSSSSGASSVSSKAFSFNLKTPGQSLVNEATHSVFVPLKLELLEEEEEVSDRKDVTGTDLVVEDPWNLDNRKQLVPCVEGMEYFDGPMPQPRVNASLHLGKDSFKLKKCLGEGAYGKVYRAEEQTVLKFIQNDTTAWEMHISRILRRKAPPHLIEHFCEISKSAIYSNGSILTMPFRSEITLLNVINSKADMSDLSKAFLVHQLLLVAEALLDCSIIHADIKPDNFLLVPIRHRSDFHYHLQLIDFGRSIDMKLLPSKTRFSPSLKGDTRCVAMRLQKPWAYDLDLYSTAATAHVILFSKYLTLIEVKGVWRPTCKPKRFWRLASLYESMFEMLINPVEGEKVQLGEMRDALVKYAAEDSSVVNAEMADVFHNQL